MSNMARDLMQKIHGRYIYAGVEKLGIPEDLTGGELYPLFEQVVQAAKPGLIIEVGSWKGKTAIHMADLIRKSGLDGCVLCVDTWLGSDLVHVKHFPEDPLWGMKRNYDDFGYPRMYHQFLANVIAEGLQEWIVPFPQTSHTAARWLKENQTAASAIYIDGCHDENFVYMDCAEYWPLVAPGGVLFGDDWASEWPGVICDVMRFAHEVGLDRPQFDIEAGKWLIQRKEQLCQA